MEGGYLTFYQRWMTATAVAKTTRWDGSFNNSCEREKRVWFKHPNISVLVCVYIRMPDCSLAYMTILFQIMWLACVPHNPPTKIDMPNGVSLSHSVPCWASTVIMNHHNRFVTFHDISKWKKCATKLLYYCAKVGLLRQRRKKETFVELLASP